MLFIAARGLVGQHVRCPPGASFGAAGYRVVTFDYRGVGATASADGFTTATTVADTARLIELWCPPVPCPNEQRADTLGDEDVRTLCSVVDAAGHHLREHRNGLIDPWVVLDLVEQ